jgi:hypothetical protein
VWKSAVLRVTHKTTLCDDAIAKVLPLARSSFSGREGFVISLANSSHRAEGFCSTNTLKKVLEALGRCWDDQVTKDVACIYIVHGSTCLLELVNTSELPIIKSRVLFVDINEVVDEAKRINEKCKNSRDGPHSFYLGEYTHTKGSWSSDSEEEKDAEVKGQARREKEGRQNNVNEKVKERVKNLKSSREALKLHKESQTPLHLPTDDEPPFSFLWTQTVVVAIFFAFALIFKSNK